MSRQRNCAKLQLEQISVVLQTSQFLTFYFFPFAVSISSSPLLYFRTTQSKRHYSKGLEITTQFPSQSPLSSSSSPAEAASTATAAETSPAPGYIPVTPTNPTHSLGFVIFSLVTAVIVTQVIVDLVKCYSK